MIIKTIRVSDKGQIAIPVEIREKLNIDKGDELIIAQEDERILIEKTKRISKQMKDDFSDIRRLNEISLKKIWNNEEDEVWNQYLKK